MILRILKVTLSDHNEKNSTIFKRMEKLIETIFIGDDTIRRSVVFAKSV